MAVETMPEVETEVDAADTLEVEADINVLKIQPVLPFTFTLYQTWLPYFFWWVAVTLVPFLAVKIRLLWTPASTRTLELYFKTNVPDLAVAFAADTC